MRIFETLLSTFIWGFYRKIITKTVWLIKNSIIKKKQSTIWNLTILCTNVIMVSKLSNFIHFNAKHIDTSFFLFSNFSCVIDVVHREIRDTVYEFVGIYFTVPIFFNSVNILIIFFLNCQFDIKKFKICLNFEFWCLKRNFPVK